MMHDAGQEQRPAVPADELLVPYRFPPLIPPASREPWWLTVTGMLVFLWLLWQFWLAPRPNFVPFQQSITARAHTYIVATLRYYQHRAELPNALQRAFDPAKQAEEAAAAWRAVHLPYDDGETRGMLALNITALCGVAGRWEDAQEALREAAAADRQRADCYLRLLPLYAQEARPFDFTAQDRRLLSTVPAGPLVLAREAEARGDIPAAIAALRPGARAGIRLIGVNAVIALFSVGLLLTMLCFGVANASRILRALRETGRQQGAEKPWGLGVAFIVLNASLLMARLISAFPVKSEYLQLMLSLLGTLLGPMLAIGLFLLALNRNPWQWGVLGWTSAGRGLRYGLLVILLALPLVVGVTLLSQTLFGGQPDVHPLIPVMLTERDTLLLIIMMLTTMFSAPFIEETLFRGILFRALDARLPFWAAALCSGLIFASIHNMVGALLPITLLGILFAFLTRRTNSLLASAAAHAGYNGIVTVMVLLSSWALHGPGS